MEQPDQKAPRSAWLRPRLAAWVVALVLIGGIHFFTEPIIRKMVMEPAAKSDLKGWLVQRGSPGSPGISSARSVVPQDKGLAAKVGTSLDAYGLWLAPKAGRYACNLFSRGSSELSIDGEPLLSLEGKTSSQVSVDLTAGPHLLRIYIEAFSGKDGSCRLKILDPDNASTDLFAKGSLLYPDVSNIKAWWKLALITRDRRVMVALAYMATLLLLLLPLSLSGGWKTLAAVSAIVFLPALALPGPPHQVPFIGGPQILRLQAEKPDFVFIGNSYADCSIDGELLGRLAGGKVEKLIYTGSETTIHYLMFKNILVASGVRPKVTFIFTRDNSLTNPHLMVFPRAFDTLSPDQEEPLVQELVFGDHRLREYLRKLPAKLFGVSAYQAEAEEVVPTLAQALTRLTVRSSQASLAGGVRKEANQRFDLNRLRRRIDSTPTGQPEQWNADYNPDLYLDFDKVVESSFLPHMIKLARDNGIKLVFVRIQRRPTQSGPPPQDPRLVRYIERLRDYLVDKQGVGFHDFTGDPELTLPMYMEDDHIADAEGATKLFYKRMAWAFR